MCIGLMMSRLIMILVAMMMIIIMVMMLTMAVCMKLMVVMVHWEFAAHNNEDDNADTVAVC